MVPKISLANLTVLLYFLTPISSGVVGAAVDLDQVLDNHLAAVGGVENVEALRNLKLRLSIWEPEFEVEGLYRASSDGRMRIDVFAGENRVFSEGIDELGGWQQNGKGTAILEISDEGLLALERGVQRNLSGLMAYSATDGNIQLLERLALAGTNYFVLETLEKDGTRRQHFIHPQRWLVERSRETKALHPDIDSSEVSTEERHTLFKPLCGLMRSHLSESFDRVSGKLIQTTKILQASCNVSETELDLARPPGA